MKYEIKNGPPWPQGNSQHPLPRTPQTIVHLLQRHWRFYFSELPLSFGFSLPVSPFPLCSTTQTLLPPISPLLLITHMQVVIIVSLVSWPCLQCLFIFLIIHQRQILLIVQGGKGLCSVKLFSLVDYSTSNQLISSLPCKMPTGGILLETSILGFFQENTQPKFNFRWKADLFHRLLEEIKDFFPPSLLKMRIMNMQTYVCLPGSLSFCLFV